MGLRLPARVRKTKNNSNQSMFLPQWPSVIAILGVMSSKTSAKINDMFARVLKMQAQPQLITHGYCHCHPGRVMSSKMTAGDRRAYAEQIRAAIPSPINITHGIWHCHSLGGGGYILTSFGLFQIHLFLRWRNLRLTGHLLLRRGRRRLFQND